MCHYHNHINFKGDRHIIFHKFKLKITVYILHGLKKYVVKLNLCEMNCLLYV